MIVREKVYSGVFILIVFGATLILNTSKTNKKANTKNQLEEQLQLSEVSFNKAKAILKLKQESIEIGGDLEVEMISENNKIMFLWNKIDEGENKYEVWLNDKLKKKIKSNGRELFYVITNSEFESGNNKVTIKTTARNGESVSGVFYLDFEELMKQEISFSE